MFGAGERRWLPAAAASLLTVVAAAVALAAGGWFWQGATAVLGAMSVMLVWSASRRLAAGHGRTRQAVPPAQASDA